MRINGDVLDPAPTGRWAGAVGARILVVDDDPAIQRLLTLSLTQAGHQVLTVADGPEALQQFADHVIDFVVLAANLPGMDGYAVCQELRKRTLAPILLLLETGTPLDERVMAIELGADGYLTKPFSQEELIARVGALLARAGKSSVITAPPSLVIGALELDEWRQQVTVRGQPIHVTPHEFQLLRYLMRHSDREISKEELLTRVWPANFKTTQKNELSRLRVTIYRLRSKIEEDPAHPCYLKTIHRVGYQFCSGSPV